MSKFRQIKRHLERKAAAESEAKRTQERLEREKQHREKLAARPKEEKEKDDLLIKGLGRKYSHLLLTSALLASLSPIDSHIK